MSFVFDLSVRLFQQRQNTTECCHTLNALLHSLTFFSHQILPSAPLPQTHLSTRSLGTLSPKNTTSGFWVSDPHA